VLRAMALGCEIQELTLFCSSEPGRRLSRSDVDVGSKRAAYFHRKGYYFL
jgi:hypothetical protein